MMQDFDFGLGEDIDTLRATVAKFAAERIAPLAADTARVMKGGTINGTDNEHTAGARLTSPAPRLKKPLWIILPIRHSLPPSSPRPPSPGRARRASGRFSPNSD